jgi:Sugar (and other) transporter
MLVVAKNLGLVVGYAINSYIDYYTVPFFILGIFVVFCLGFPMVADSPRHLMTQGRDQDALDALKYYRGFDGDDSQFLKEYAVEIAELKSFAQSTTNGGDKLTYKDFCKLLPLILKFL